MDDLVFEAGYPTDTTAEALFEEFDYQAAVQAYVWATPLMSNMGMWKAVHRDGGVEPGEMAFLIFNQQRPNQTIMTANDQVCYVWPPLINTAEVGPLVVEVPPGTLGISWDLWMHGVADLGNLGPDGGKGGKYLFLPVGYDGEIPDGYFPVQLKHSDHIQLVLRTFPAVAGLDAAIEHAKTVKMYALSEVDHPKPNRFIVMDDTPFDGDWPKDEGLFELLAEALTVDRVPEMALSTIGNLRRLGIRRGQPFQPDERARRILARAAKTGHDIVLAMAFNNRFDDKLVYEDRQWEKILHYTDYEFMPNGEYQEVEARASYYQIIGNGVTALAPSKPGTGIFYTTTYKDAHGDMLNGSNTYKLSMPADVPVAQFWQIPVYSNQTRSLINTGSPATKSSTDRLITNDDGSVDVYFGPEPPKGMKQNWVKTIPDEGWFVLLRLYGPQAPILDKTWKPNDIEKINRSSESRP